MNKTYQTPDTLIVTLEPQHLMAGSMLTEDSNGNPTQELGETTNEKSGNISRRRNMWDEEEDY